MATAPLSWQERCTQALHAAAMVGGTPGRTQWEVFRDQARLKAARIVIADRNFDGMGLEGFDLSRCWIGRCTFGSANLSNAQFVQSIFRECDATNANIEGANFRQADLAGDGLRLMTKKFDEATNFEVDAISCPIPWLRD